MINEKIDITISKQTAMNINSILKEINTEKATLAGDCLYYAVQEREANINAECAKKCSLNHQKSKREREEWEKSLSFYKDAEEQAKSEHEKTSNMLDRILRKERN